MIHVLCAMRDCRVIQQVMRDLDDGERCTFQVVGNGDAVLDSVRSMIPDILVIDAVLPHMDGLGVIDQLSALLGPRMPRVIGGSMMPFTDAGFVKRGVKRLVRVPWEKEQLYQAIVETMGEICGNVDWERAQESQERAAYLLEKMGMKSSLRGFSYLSWAGALAYDDESRLYAIGEKLYKPIAEYCGTTVQSVERLIRHAVECTLDSVGAYNVYGFFGNTIDPTRGKPTNAQMIGMLVQRMRVSS